MTFIDPVLERMHSDECPLLAAARRKRGGIPALVWYVVGGAVKAAVLGLFLGLVFLGLGAVVVLMR